MLLAVRRKDDGSGMFESVGFSFIDTASSINALKQVFYEKKRGVYHNHSFHFQSPQWGSLFLSLEFSPGVEHYPGLDLPRSRFHGGGM
jgi:hypothetical protein